MHYKSVLVHESYVETKETIFLFILVFIFINIIRDELNETNGLNSIVIRRFLRFGWFLKLFVRSLLDHSNNWFPS